MKSKIHFFQPRDAGENGFLARFRTRVIAMLRDQDFWWGFLFLVILLFLFVAPAGVSVPQYKRGDIAQSTIRAPEDIQVPDTATTERKRKEAEEKILPVYDFETGLTGSALARMHDVLSSIRASIAAAGQNPDTALALDLQKQMNVSIDPKMIAIVR